MEEKRFVFKRAQDRTSPQLGHADHGRNILMSVHTEDSNERDRAKKILETAGAEDVSYTSEASVPKDHKLADGP